MRGDGMSVTTPSGLMARPWLAPRGLGMRSGLMVRPEGLAACPVGLSGYGKVGASSRERRLGLPIRAGLLR